MNRVPVNPIILFTCLLFFLAGTATTHADEVYRKNSKGNDLYRQGKFDEALKQYEDAQLVAPSDTLLKMNRGSTLYRLGRFEEAESTYTGATAIKNKRAQADAHYNLGNILFKEGDRLMQSNGQGADEKYKAALQNYIAALDQRPGDKDAKWNVELTQKRIMQAQQQKQNQDKNQKDNKDQNKKDQNKQDQNKQDQNKKDQNKQDQNKEDQNKKDQDKNKQDQDKNKQNQDQNRNQENQKQHQQGADKKEAMKKDEAKRIIAQFADDADSLNKPPKKKAAGSMNRKPEKDW